MGFKRKLFGWDQPLRDRSNSPQRPRKVSGDKQEIVMNPFKSVPIPNAVHRALKYSRNHREEVLCRILPHQRSRDFPSAPHNIPEIHISPRDSPPKEANKIIEKKYLLRQVSSPQSDIPYHWTRVKQDILHSDKKTSAFDWFAASMFIWLSTIILINTFSLGKFDFPLEWDLSTPSEEMWVSVNVISRVSFICLSGLLMLALFSTAFLRITILLLGLFTAYVTHKAFPAYFLFIPVSMAYHSIVQTMWPIIHRYILIVQKGSLAVLGNLQIFTCSIIMFTVFNQYSILVSDLISRMDSNLLKLALITQTFWILQTIQSLQTFVTARTVASWNYKENSWRATIHSFQLGMRAIGTLLTFSLVGSLIALFQSLANYFKSFLSQNSNRIWAKTVYCIIGGMLELSSQFNQFSLVYASLYSCSFSHSINLAYKGVSSDFSSTVLFASFSSVFTHLFGLATFESLTMSDSIASWWEGSVSFATIRQELILSSLVYCCFVNALSTAMKTCIVIEIEEERIRREKADIDRLLNMANYD